MSATTTSPPRQVVRAATSHSSTGPAITRRAFRQVWIGAAMCAVAFGATAAGSALSYASTFASAASRHQLVATTSADAGLAVLLGPVTGVGTVGGYTVYKGFVFLTTIGAVWSALAATRLLRGEEDAGRWQLVLAGQTTPARATAATLSALAAAVGVIIGGTAALTLLAGRDPDVAFGSGDTLLYAVSVGMPVAVFAAVGAFTSQLCRNRRAATGTALGVISVAFVLRMIGDTGTDLHWVRWTTPFGWAELVRPFTGNDLVPLVPAALTVLGLGGAAILLASRRDAGDGVLATRDVARLRPFGLGSPFGLSLRLEMGVLIAWCIGAAATGGFLGIIAKLTTGRLPTSLGDTLHGFGVRGGFAHQYLGVAFLLAATVVALISAGQLAAAGEEETTGRLAPVLAGPVGRGSWFAGRLAIAGVAIFLAGLLTGLGAWLGAQSQGLDLGLSTLLGAGLNVVPTALLALGLGALAFAVVPRAGAVAVYAVVAWSLIVDILASQVSGLAWIRKSSLFHSMALAPAQRVEPVSVVTRLALALALGGAAVAVFRRGDLAPG
jgi:ABC-2 type transport system permease protein